MPIGGLTLARHVLQAQQAHPDASGEFSTLLTQIGLASKLIAREISRGALAGVRGTLGAMNVQGEAVTKLDVVANEIMLDCLEHSGLVCSMVSEEMDSARHSGAAARRRGKYVVSFDPVDGSSNIDINGVIGTIFSIRRSAGGGPDPVVADILRPGTEQVAAGYVMYGPSTVFVYTARDGVHGFTLDPTLGEFLLSSESIRIPARGRIYSVNEGNSTRWHAHTRRLVERLRAGGPEGARPYSLRYVGSLVADVHRTLLEGGIFLYPEDAHNPKQPTGKLRLLYEAAPLGFVVEEAGGRASTGRERILEIQPASLHQRVPLIIGSPEDVALAESFYRDLP